MRSSVIARSLALVLLVTLAGCGKKGPPLAPLRLVPNPVSELTARRGGDDVELSFTLPAANANGPGAIDMAKVEIYAITIGPGGVTPPNRDLLVSARVVGTLAVKPPPVEGEGEPAGPPDKRPGPGDRVTFVETLTAEKLKPVVIVQKPVAKGKTPPAQGTTPDPAGQKPDATGEKPDPSIQKPEAAGQKPEATGQKPGVAAQKPDVAGQQTTTGVTKPDPEAGAPEAPVPAPLTGIAALPTRIYAIRGLSRAGHAGPASTRVIVPLTTALQAPTGVAAQMPSEKAVVVDWTAPVAEAGMPPLAFNIYRREATTAPLNPSPLTEVRFEVGSVEFGKELCFVVRTIQTVASVTLESAPSAPGCLTPLDKFPPLAPKGLRAVAEDGAVSLVWDQNAEADLGGYVVLRGEAPGDTLLPLTPQPIKDANYRDPTVKPGVRYVYAVVAVDAATPRNDSAPSAREEVTAR